MVRQGWNGASYDSTEHINNLVKELLFYHFDLGYQMQRNLEEYGAERFNNQALKVSKIQAKRSSVVSILYEVIRLNVPFGNERRLADGGRNHTTCHLDPPRQHIDDTSSLELGTMREIGIIVSKACAKCSATM